jgi:hypothetical protein
MAEINTSINQFEIETEDSPIGAVIDFLDTHLQNFPADFIKTHLETKRNKGKFNQSRIRDIS